LGKPCRSLSKNEIVERSRGKPWTERTRDRRAGGMGLPAGGFFWFSFVRQTKENKGNPRTEKEIVLMLQCQFNQQEHKIDKSADPPVQNSEKEEENHDHRRACDEEPLPQRDAENFSFVPCVHRKMFPEYVQEESHDRRDR